MLNRKLIKILWGDRKKNLLHIAIIVISLIGFLGIDITSNYYFNNAYYEMMDDYLVDFSVWNGLSNFDEFPSNLSIISDKITLQSYFRSQVLMIDASYSIFLNSSSLGNHSNYNQNQFIDTIFPFFIIGIEFDIFQDPSFSGIFFDDNIPTNKTAIYLNSKLMSIYNYTPGETINFELYNSDELMLNFPESIPDPSIKIENLTISNSLMVQNPFYFMQLFSLLDIWQYFDMFPIILIDSSNLYDKFLVPQNIINFFTISNRVNFLINRNSLGSISVGKLKNVFGDISQKFAQTMIEYNIGVSESYDSPLLYGISALQDEFLLFKIFYPIISIPVFIISIFFLKVSYDSYFQQNQRKIMNLRMYGIKNRQIMMFYVIKSFVIGIIAGLLGFFICSLFTPLLFSSIFQGINLHFLSVLNLSFFSWSSFAFSILIGIIINFIGIFLVIKKILIKDSHDLLTHGQNDNTHKLNAKKLLIPLFILLFISLISFVPFNYFMPQFYWDDYFFLSLLISFGTYIAPFIPYLLILVFSIIFIENQKKVQILFLKIKKMNNPDSIFKYPIKSALKSGKSVAQMFLILSLSFGILFQTLILGEVVNTQRQNDNLIMDGSKGYSFPISYNLFNKTIEQFSSLDLELEKAKETIGYSSKISLMWTRNVSYHQNNDNYRICCINATEWERNVNFPDNWLSNDYLVLIRQLQEKNTILVSEYFLENSNSSIGDTILVDFYGIDQELIHRSMTIIGSYRRFPFLTDTVTIGAKVLQFISDQSNFLNIRVHNIFTTFYFENEFDYYQKYMDIRNVLIDYDPASYLFSDFFDGNTDWTVIRLNFDFIAFFQIDIYNIIILFMLFFLLITNLDANNLKEDWIKMRIHGMSSRKILLNYFLKNVIIIIISLFLCIFANIFGSSGLIIGLNAQNYFSFPYQLVIPIREISLATFLLIATIFAGTIINGYKTIKDINLEKRRGKSMLYELKLGV